MPDVVVAEIAGRCWLMRGEPHLDDLLMNALAPELEVEIVACVSVEEMHALWASHGGHPERGEQPWMIHPNILVRLRDAARAETARTVAFEPWSARIGDRARATIADAARAAAADAGATVVIEDALDAEADEDLAGLVELRRKVLRTSLVAAGVAPERVRARSRPSAAPSPEALDVVAILLEPTA